MTILDRAAARLAHARSSARRAMAGALGGALLAISLVACGSNPSEPPGASEAGSAPPASAEAPIPSPTPSPTPVPTPVYTNPPDAALAALIPAEVNGAPVVVPDAEEFAITPGDFGGAYGDLGLRFTSLQVAYVASPRLSLFAARVAPPAVSSRELEPHLETAGRYVGIAGLEREPWELVTIGDRVAWVRPEDNATAAGTMIYTWAAEEFVFLMIGVDDEVNRALFAALPGEAAPTPEPSPTRSARPHASASPTGDAGQSAGPS